MDQGLHPLDAELPDATVGVGPGREQGGEDDGPARDQGAMCPPDVQACKRGLEPRVALPLRLRPDLVAWEPGLDQSQIFAFVHVLAPGWVCFGSGLPHTLSTEV